MKHLYIIGNGFDLHHGIPSSYYNYMHWLCVNYPELYDEISRTFINAEQKTWWSDFEHHLAEVEYMYDLSAVIYPDYEIEGIALKGKNSPERLSAVYKAVQMTFSVWVRGLNDFLIGVHPDLPLDVDATYLSFNYTNTLQNVYGIPDEHVLHIHGNAEKGEDIIIGHDSSGANFQYMQSEIIDIEGLGYAIGKQISTFQKPTAKIIESNRAFFESLRDIERITVYGFSFSSIDMPYVKEIIKFTSENVVWHIYVYSIDELKRFEKLNKELLLNMEYELC